MNLSPYIALGIGEDFNKPFFRAGVGGRVFKLLGSESGLEPKWQCHFGCECLPTYSLQVRAQQVPKCTQTSRKWNGQSSKAFPFCNGKVAMCQMFWFQNSLLVQLGMSQHNICDTQSGVVTFATHARPQDKGHHPPKPQDADVQGTVKHTVA